MITASTFFCTAEKESLSPADVPDRVLRAEQKIHARSNPGGDVRLVRVAWVRSEPDIHEMLPSPIRNSKSAAVAYFES